MLKVRGVVPSRAEGLAWVALFVVPPLIALLVYWPYLDTYFVNDDWSYLRGVRDGNVFEAFARGFTFPPFTEFSGPTPYFRPLPDLSYKLLYEWFGLDATPHHVVNLVAHSVTSVVGGVLIARMARSILAGLLAAVMFAGWPSYETTVTWMAQLGELFCAAFGTLGLLAAQLFLTSRTRRAAFMWLAVSACALLLAALSKQTAVIAFVMLPVLWWAETDRRRTRQETLAAAGILGGVVMAAAGLWVYEQLYEAGAREVTSYEFSKWRVFETYFRHLVWPFSGSVFLQRVLLIGYVVLGLWHIVTGRRAGAFFFVWSVVALVPYAFVAGPEQVRYTYLAALPFWGLISISAVEFIESVSEDRRIIGAAVACAGAVVLAVFAWRETRSAQVFLVSQGAASARVVAAIEGECPEMPRESTLYVLGGGVLDPFGTNNRALVNMLQERVYFRQVTERPEPLPQPPDCFVDARPVVDGG